jgi:hypothetical protein
MDEPNYTHDLFIKVDKLKDIIAGIGIDISPVVYTIRFFILPNFDYLFHITAIPLEWMDRMDSKKRK